MLTGTLAIFCACLLLVQGAKSDPKKINAEVTAIIEEAIRNTNDEKSPGRACGLHFAGYDYKSYQRESQRGGTTYYVTVDAKYPRDKVVNSNREFVIFKPKGNGKASITQTAC